MKITKERWREAQAHEGEFWARRADIAQEWKRVQRFTEAVAQVDAQLPDDALILDLGSGPTCPAQMFKKGRKVFVDPLMVTYASIPHHTLPHAQGVCVAAMGEMLPLPDNSVDACICINALDHMLNPQAVLKELRRAMKPNAVFLLGIFVRPWFYVALRHLLEKLSPRFREIPHPHRYTGGRVRHLLTNAGLQLVYDHRVGRKARFQWARRSDWVFIAKKTS